MTFEFVYVYCHIYRKWVFLVDTKCRNTVILTGLTYTSSREVFHDGYAKGGTFFHQILNKNRLSLAHCALNRSFTVCHLESFSIILNSWQNEGFTECHLILTLAIERDIARL